MKSATFLRIPTAIITPSWDHLTTKALIQIFPDKVFVWNEEHRKAAIEYHHVPPEKISITGAPQFDEWFERRGPGKNREDFCREFSLNPRKSFLLYISSVSAGERNVGVIKKLRSILNNSPDQKLRDATLLVRPYPGRPEQSAISGERDIFVLPAPAESRRTLDDDLVFYDSVYHSFATVALDSAAFMDSMAIGRPCIIYIDKEFKDIQQAEHFALLVESGALYVAHSAEELLGSIGNLASGNDPLRTSRLTYLGRFIRPRGLEENAGRIVVDEIEQLIREKRGGK